MPGVTHTHANACAVGASLNDQYIGSTQRTKRHVFRVTEELAIRSSFRQSPLENVSLAALASSLVRDTTDRD